VRERARPDDRKLEGRGVELGDHVLRRLAAGVRIGRPERRLLGRKLHCRWMAAKSSAELFEWASILAVLWLVQH